MRDNVEKFILGIVAAAVVMAMFYDAIFALLYCFDFVITIQKVSYKACIIAYFIFIIIISIVSCIFWCLEIKGKKLSTRLYLLKQIILIFSILPLICCAIYFSYLIRSSICEFDIYIFFDAVYAGIMIGYIICYIRFAKKNLFKELSLLIKGTITVASTIVYLPLFFTIPEYSEKVFTFILIVFLISDFVYDLISKHKSKNQKNIRIIKLNVKLQKKNI